MLLNKPQMHRLFIGLIIEFELRGYFPSIRESEKTQNVHFNSH